MKWCVGRPSENLRQDFTGAIEASPAHRPRPAFFILSYLTLMLMHMNQHTSIVAIPVADWVATEMD
jgi:hypothetical protein